MLLIRGCRGSKVSVPPSASYPMHSMPSLVRSRSEQRVVLFDHTMRCVRRTSRQAAGQVALAFLMGHHHAVCARAPLFHSNSLTSMVPSRHRCGRLSSVAPTPFSRLEWEKFPRFTSSKIEFPRIRWVYVCMVGCQCQYRSYLQTDRVLPGLEKTCIFCGRFGLPALHVVLASLSLQVLVP